MTEHTSHDTPADTGRNSHSVLSRAWQKAYRICSASFNAAITLSVRTNKRRWRRVAQDPNPHWDWRNQIISKTVPAGVSVLDLGCGAQTLRRHLSPDCKYQPCDLVKSSPDVILCDFNEGLYPEVSETYDYVICSGVLEYIRNPQEFLRRCSAFGKTMILSYCPLVPGQGRLDRLAVNWINHFKASELEALFTESGLSWSVVNRQPHGETIYSLSRESTDQRRSSSSLGEPAGIGNKCDERH